MMLLHKLLYWHLYELIWPKGHSEMAKSYSDNAKLPPLSAKTYQTRPFTHECTLEESMAKFLIPFALRAEIAVPALLQWIEHYDDTSESAQVMIICHWQNWMYYTQFSNDELPKLEQNVHPYPIILNLDEAKPNLLNLNYILTESCTQPVDRTKDREC